MGIFKPITKIFKKPFHKESVEIKKAEIHPKGWGREEWIVNNEKYCGKKMFLSKGKKCSIHFHKIKHETFYIEMGLIQLDLYPNGYPGELDRKVLKSGDVVPISIGVPHQFLGLEDSTFYEFSTRHLEEDSHRLVKGD